MTSITDFYAADDLEIPLHEKDPLGILCDPDDPESAKGSRAVLHESASSSHHAIEMILGTVPVNSVLINSLRNVLSEESKLTVCRRLKHHILRHNVVIHRCLQGGERLSPELRQEINHDFLEILIAEIMLSVWMEHEYESLESSSL